MSLPDLPNSVDEDTLGRDPLPTLSVEGAFLTGNLTGLTVAHFAIEEQLGGGAMATVYRAHNLDDGRTVALKVLNPGADDTARERFRREANTALALEHPNIVRGSEVGQISDGGMFYIVMDLVTGCSLADLLEKEGRLSPRDACLLLAPIARALDYAHRRGIIHRDVKPSNILLQTAPGESSSAVHVSAINRPVVPLLSDFGIARALDAPELTSAGRTIGTPAFMSPEQCAGNDEIDGRADIYSLGAVLFRCLVGRTPFVGSTTQILHAHVYDPLLIPTDVLQALPEGAMGLLRRSLMKEPGERYQSAAEMADELAKVATLAASPAPAPAPEADATRTMDSLPVTDGGRVTSSHILVPARPPSGPVIPPAPVTRGVIRQESAAPAQAKPKPGGTKAGGVRLGMALLGGALLVLVAMMAITLMSGVLPFLGGKPDLAGKASVTPAVAVAGTPADETTAPPTATPEPAKHESAAGEEGDGAAGETSDKAESTRLPPLEASLDYAWETAQALYGERDWSEAATWLIAVQRIDPEFQKATVSKMLAEALIEQATARVRAGKIEDALSLLEAAAEALPEETAVAVLRDAAAGLAAAEAGEEDSAREALGAAILEYAAMLAGEERVCDAAVQAALAVSLSGGAEARGARQRYDEECAAQTLQDTITSMTGSLLISSVEDSQYRIFRVPVAQGGQPALVIEDGSQPAMDPTGQIVAFHSMRPDALGLAGFDLTAGMAPDSRATRYTNMIDDARDSPPSWNPQGNRLVFASTRYGDGRSRVYVTWANGEDNTTEIGFGKDPAWHPTQDLIVMNGADDTGSSPGLWLINPDGGSRTRLTDNGNDQRPAWTPDGRSVVFMSNGRDDNWEVYRVDVVGGTVTRLTWNLAQDGIPAVSPDGQWVAFMSDREGFWRLWFTPIEGGEAQPLASIPGSLPSWLEHAVQWVR